MLYICAVIKNLNIMRKLNIKTKRDELFHEVERLEIEINGVFYRISESVDHKLTINKTGMDEESMMVFPRYANEIDIK